MSFPANSDVQRGEHRFAGPGRSYRFGNGAKSRLLYPAIVACCFTSPAGTQTTELVIPLAEGQIVTRTQTVGESVTYSFNAKPGRSYFITVTQDDLDFIVTVSDGDGTSRSHDSPLRRYGPELVAVQSGRGGRIRIVVNSAELTNAEGTHTIELQSGTDWAGNESHHIAAWRLMSEASAANADGGNQSTVSARSLYAAAGELWEAAGRKEMQAHALLGVSMIDYWNLEDFAGAMESADRAATLYREIDARAEYANALFVRAYASIETASARNREAVFDMALATFREAYAIQDDLGNDFDKAHILNFIGITHWYRGDSALGDLDAARRYYRQSIDLFSRIYEWREELNGLQNIVVLDYAQGKRLQAIDAFEEILSRLPQGRDPTLRATVLGNLGIVHLAFGNIDESLRAHTDAREIYVSLGDKTGQGYSLKNIGQTYFSFGDLDGARRYLVQARALGVETNDERTLANILSILGDIEFAEKDYSTALERHREAVALTASTEERAVRKLLVAKDLAALERHDEAIAECRAAFEESRSETTKADALLQLALNHIARGEIDEALMQLADASKTFDELKLSARQGDVFQAYSLAARYTGDLEAAAEYGRAALDRTDSLRERAAHPEVRALSSATRQAYYEHQIDLLMELHEASGTNESDYLLEALATSERSRARMTMDLLSEAAVELNRGMSPELAQKRRDLYGALAEKRQLQDQAESPAEFQRLASKMDEIEVQIILLETEFRRMDTQYLGYASTDTLDAAQIQAQVDPDSVLLQFALGDRRSFLWAVTSNAVRGYVLPDRNTLEQAARDVYAKLRLPPGSRDAREMSRLMSDLSGKVLGPVHDALDDKARILIAADGALHYIPFAVLPITSRRSGAASTPLVALRDDTEIISVPSVSVRAALASSGTREAASDSIAIFADPVMERTDIRLTRNSVETSPAIVEADTQSTRAGSGPALSRLPYTGEEAAAIADLVPADSRFLATGFAANLDTVVNEDLRSYRYIHFATHGIVDAEHPALSALALSQFDEQGGRVPGYLRLHDIYSLELSADVVVLSACETGLGREIHGEGFVGLTQGFIYAGARSLVASLWQVPDLGTSALMTRFYDGLLKGGLSPSRALAAAQRSMLATRGRSDPFFWGAFVIQGDWW